MLAKGTKYGTAELRHHILPVVSSLVVLLICSAGAGMVGAQNGSDKTDCLTFTRGEPFMVLLENYGESRVLFSKGDNTLVTKEINPATEGQGRVFLETQDWPEGEYDCTIHTLVSINADYRYLSYGESIGGSFLLGTTCETDQFSDMYYNIGMRVIEVTGSAPQPLYDLEVVVWDKRWADDWTYDTDIEETKQYCGYGWFAENADTSFKFYRIVSASYIQPIICGAGWALARSISINVVPDDLTSMKFEQGNDCLYLLGEGDRLLWKWNVGDDIDEVPVSSNTSYLTTRDQESCFTISSKVAATLFNDFNKATIEAANSEMAKGYNMTHPLELLTQSDQAFQDRLYQESLDLLLKARGLVVAPGLAPIAYSNAQTALVDAGQAITAGKSGGFDMARAEVSLAEAQQYFDDADYATALTVAQEATQQATDVDGDGVPNETDFAPTINNNLIYGGAAVLCAVAVGALLRALRRYSSRRRREEKEIEAQKAEIISMIEKAVGNEVLHKPEKKG
jgi:hypothetical protein